MAQIAAWEFDNTAVFDGVRLFAEAKPNPNHAIRVGTLEIAFTPARINRATVFSHGVPGRDAGAFTLVLTNSGALTLSCTDRNGVPFRLRTADGFVSAGERALMSLSWGIGGRFVAVNCYRLSRDPGNPDHGYVSPLPLRARCDLRGTHKFTFGAASGGMAPFFEGQIHSVSLSDTVDDPSVAPPSAKVHVFPRSDFTGPRRVVSRQFGDRSGRPITRPRSLTSGMRVATSGGDVPLGRLSPGTEVLTRNGGFKPVRWIGRVSVGGRTLRDAPAVRSVVIRRGGLGPNLPEADLLIAPYQRLLVPGAAAQEPGPQEDGLLDCAALRALPGIEEVETIGASYVHFYCDETTSVQINGLWVELLNPNDQQLDAVQERARETLLALFPALRLAHDRIRR